MSLELDMATWRAVIDELKRRMGGCPQKKLAYAVADRRGDPPSTWTPRISRLLRKDDDAIRQAFSPEHAADVLAAICGELGVEVESVLRAAHDAVERRARAAPDRHGAWLDLDDATPWVDRVPGLADGLSTLRHIGHRVIWLTGPRGIGKSAWLWRAQQDQLGQLVGKRSRPCGIPRGESSCCTAGSTPRPCWLRTPTAAMPGHGRC
jgi:hypothetical protein